MAISEGFLFSALPNYARDADNGGTGVAASTPINRIVSSEPSEFVLFSDATKSPYHYASLLPNLGTNDNRGDDVNFCAIINHNLTAGVGGFIFDIWDTTGGPPVQPGSVYEVPDAIAASTNTSGAVTNIDGDPDAADGLWITAVSASANTQIRLQFSTAATPGHIRIGASLQEFRIWVRRTASGVNHPTLAADLYDNGTFVRTLFTGQGVSSTSGQVFSGLWNFSEASSHANVEIRLTGTTTGTATVEYGEVRWIIDSDGGGRILSSSGWQTVDAEDAGTLVGGAIGSTVGLPATKNQLYAFPSTVTGSSKAVQVRFRDMTNADGYLRIGLVVVSYAFQPTLGVARVTPGVIDNSETHVTLGGQEGGSNVRKRRKLSVEFPVLTSEEAATLYERIDFLKGTRIPLLVCAFPTDSRWRSLMLLWATMGRDSSGVALSVENFPSESGGSTPANLRSWTAAYSFEEKL